MSERESDGGIGIAGITPEEARLRAEGPDGHSRRVPLVAKLAAVGITPGVAGSTVPISTDELNKLLDDRQEGMRLLRDRDRLEAEVSRLEAVRDELAAALHRLWVAVHYQSAVPEAMAEAGRLLSRPSITIAQCLAGEEPADIDELRCPNCGGHADPREIDGVLDAKCRDCGVVVGVDQARPGVEEGEG